MKRENIYNNSNSDDEQDDAQRANSSMAEAQRKFMSDNNIPYRHQASSTNENYRHEANQNTQPQPQPTNSNQNIAPVTKKHHYKRTIGIVILVVIIAIFAWFMGTEHSANNPTPQTNQPRVVRKTIIKQPSQSSNPAQQRINNLENEMQQLKLSNQQQNELRDLYMKQNAQTQAQIYKWASFLGNMKFVPESSKQQAVIWALNHFSNN